MKKTDEINLLLYERKYFEFLCAMTTKHLQKMEWSVAESHISKAYILENVQFRGLMSLTYLQRS